jgi:RHS repeat-associated protein
VQSECWGNSYADDAWGNLLQKNVTKAARKRSPWRRRPTIGWSLQLRRRRNMLSDSFHAYTYDAEGMLKSVDNGAAVYTYDADGMLTSVDSGAATYLYAAGGERVYKSTSAGATEYFYFGGNIVAERNVSTGGWTNYIFFNGKRVARRDPSGAVHYYLGDHLGSTSMVVSAGGAIENESEFYPFGGELQFSASADNHYKFTGKERDAESNLDYFGARNYSSTLGRWVTPDPQLVTLQRQLDPQQWTRYSYGRNNPTAYIDPDGRDIIFKSEADAQKAVAAAQGGLPASQRSAVTYTREESGQLRMKVDPKAVKKAGTGSLLATLQNVITSKKVVQYNYVSADTPINMIRFGVASVQESKSLQQMGNDAVTLPEFGDKDHKLYNNVGLNSAEPGKTEVYISNSAADQSLAFWHETVVHVDTFFETGNAKMSDESHNQDKAEAVETEVKKNESDGKTSD